ncbi:hypothetical protein DGMP_01610 [Desulfomarina profundi]|uniref:NrS-1 polymerase-like helicase domain-containing protein n=1 Tax=Desulfomarina profundi TaxID=2772557 RepID=A0A8D5FIK3_9BACT|nr:DUF5906 domain-containing protein [Desulfomarina profundi]BCL59468.1 hypothetical protein DGMP_01610 [Desulfomarina profundi]
MSKKIELPNTSSQNTMRYSQEIDELVSFTKFTKKDGNLTKTISLDENGTIEKDSSECYLSEGIAETVTTKFKDLPKYINRLEQNQAISIGISSKNKTKICSRRQIDRLSEKVYITRTLDNFCFPERKQGLILLDCDSDIPVDEVLEILSEIIPDFDQTARIIKPSVSAGLHRKSTGKQLSGGNSAHIYALVQNAADIQRFGKVLHERLILAGHGHVEFSKDGKILIRTLVDQYVYSPERLIFEAPPILVGDIEQSITNTKYIKGKALDTVQLQELSGTEIIQYENILRELRDKNKGKAEEIHAKFIKKEGKRIATEHNIPIQEAEKRIESRSKGILSGDDIINFDNGTSSTVRIILQNPELYDGKTMPDPLEPDYGGGRNKAILYANAESGVPLIHSFAHGERTYFLLYDFKDLDEMFTNGPRISLAESAELLVNADVTDAEYEVLIQKIRNKLSLGAKIVRTALKNAQAQTTNHSVEDEEQYKTELSDTLNLRYGVATYGGKTVIIEEKYDEVLECYSIAFHKSTELSDYYANQPITNPNTKKRQNIFQAWLKSCNRNTFDDVIFKPDSTTFRSGDRVIQQGGKYNLWQGYTLIPAQGDCSLILQHIREVWCGGDEEMYEYVLNWLADMFQHPERPGKTALVLRSGQGAGKNIIADKVIAYFFGIHALIANRADDFLGRFNSALGHAVFVFVNEAVWGGNKEKQGILKALITDRYITIERKYHEGTKVSNCSHLLFSSNESWVAPTEIGDRRFVYLPVSDHKKGDAVYFKNLVSQIENKGRAAFLYEMLNRDLSDVDLTRMPANQSAQRLTDQLQSAAPHIKFISDILGDPLFESYRRNKNFTEMDHPLELVWNADGWTVIKDDLFIMYQIFCKNSRHDTPVSKDVFFRLINRDIPGLITTCKPSDNNKRLNCVKFQAIDDARTIFKEATGFEIEREA